MSRLRPSHLLVAAIAALVAAAAPASVTAAPLQGTAAIDGSPYGVTPIGDVNGDGYDDLSAGGNAVIWGDANPASPLDASADLGTRGAKFPTSVTVGGATGLGDLDGDGYDDFAIGGEFVNPAQGGYVVYGAPGRTGIPVAPGPRVSFIKSGYTAASLRGIGDFNGDGFEDIVARRSTASASNSSVRGGITVILGGPRLATIDANAASTRTLVINATTSCKVQWIIFVPVGYSCVAPFGGGTAVGDFDGDGKDDLYYDTNRDDGRFILLGRAAASGTMTASAPTGGSIKLTPYLGSEIASFNWAPEAVGDLNADGKDDFVTARYPGPSDFGVFYGRSGLTSKTLDIGQPSLTIKSDPLNGVAGAGDTDGDGADDLVLTTRASAGIPWVDSYDIGLLQGFKARAAGTVIQPSTATPVPGVPLGFSGGQFTTLSGVRGAGDVDGDGLSDLIVGDDGGRTVVATRGPDRAPPELLLNRSAGDVQPVIAKVTPEPFRPGPGAASINVALKEAATVTFEVRRGNQTLGSFARTLPKWKSDISWDGRVGGQDLAAGDYTLALTPRDESGNTGITRTIPFNVTSSAPAAPATITFKATVKGPDGVQIGGTVSGTLRCLASSDEWSATTNLPQVASGSTVDVEGGPRYAGSTCALSAGLSDQPGSVAGCNWTSVTTFNGTPWLDGSGGATLVAGSNRMELTITCTGGRYVTTPPPGQFSSNRWKSYGSATLVPSSATATMTSQANESGALLWPDPVDPSGWEYNLYSTMRGGNGQAEGVALSFIPATTILPLPGPSPLGGSGGGLGIGGIPATTVALDAYGNPGDPAAAFVGIAQSSTANKLNYVASADPGVRLRGNPVALRVVYKAGVLTVFVNYKQRLQRTISLPDRVYVAISGSTGTIFQTQLIGNLITLPAN